MIYHWINKTDVESNVNEIAWIMLNIPILVVKLFDIGIFNFSLKGLYKYFENRLSNNSFLNTNVVKIIINIMIVDIKRASKISNAQKPNNPKYKKHINLESDQ